MAAPVLIKIKSATFRGSEIISATNAEIRLQGSEQTARGSGAGSMQIAYVEGIHARVTVQANQGQIAADAHILPGNGSLVIVGFTQADGAGASGGGDKTWTFPNATLNNSSRGLPIDGNPQVSMDFTCVAASGDPADIFSVA